MCGGEPSLPLEPKINLEWKQRFWGLLTTELDGADFSTCQTPGDQAGRVTNTAAERGVDSLQRAQTWILLQGPLIYCNTEGEKAENKIPIATAQSGLK